MASQVKVELRVTPEIYALARSLVLELVPAGHIEAVVAAIGGMPRAQRIVGLWRMTRDALELKHPQATLKLAHLRQDGTVEVQCRQGR
jgi:hypothetical protein